MNTKDFSILLLLEQRIGLEEVGLIDVYIMLVPSYDFCDYRPKPTLTNCAPSL